MMKMKKNPITGKTFRGSSGKACNTCCPGSSPIEYSKTGDCLFCPYKKTPRFVRLDFTGIQYCDCIAHNSQPTARTMEVPPPSDFSIIIPHYPAWYGRYMCKWYGEMQFNPAPETCLYNTSQTGTCDITTLKHCSNPTAYNWTMVTLYGGDDVVWPHGTDEAWRVVANAYSMEIFHGHFLYPENTCPESFIVQNEKTYEYSCETPRHDHLQVFGYGGQCEVTFGSEVLY